MININFLIKLSLIFIAVFMVVSCMKEVPQEEDKFSESVSLIPISDQRQEGDPVLGLEYLLYGDYISSGFPYDFFVSNFPGSNNVLKRSGLNASVPFSFNAVTADNGVDIVAPNCFQCHGQYLEGEFVLGLGNYDSDYTFDQSGTLAFTDVAIVDTYGQNSLEWEAYEPFSRATKTTAPYLVAEVKGVNPADKLTAVLGAHRQASDLTWLVDPQYEIPDGLIPTDVPPLWLMKKKNALYYTGSGRGDHARLISAAELLTLPDVEKAEEVDQNFIDVYAYLKTMEAPQYPKNISTELAAEGEVLFNNHCAKCHGTYGDNETYPNLLVELDYLGTDPELANANFAYSDFLDWYNSSWYNSGEGSAYFEKSNGYIAPPLDGVWATAPYLHNASVPNLETLLNSPSRPKLWQRSDEYDYEQVGWEFIEFTSSAGSTVYDTDKLGYGNSGHTFGDFLSADERKSLLEYLKTL